MQASDLAKTDFACMVSGDLEVVQILPVYNPDSSTLELRAHDEPKIAFADVNMIKFGDSTKEVNFCNMTTSLKYKTKSNPVVSKDGQTMTVDLVNGVDAKNELTATFTLLDAVHSDIKVTLDVAGAKGDDYTSGLVDEKPFAFPAGTTAKITDFVQVVADPFTYMIMNAAGEQIYQADPVMLMKEGLRYSLSVAHIETNRLHQTPLFGMGQRSGSLKVPQMDAGVHTFWNANGNGRSNGYQPFYLFENHDTSFVGVFDLSTYAQDYIVDNDRSRGEVLITQVLTGGPMVKYIFGAQKMTPPQIIARYQMLVGAPAVPPDWAFGW